MFEKFDKIPRLTKGWAVSEKIDGTNAQIHIEPETVQDWDMFYTKEQMDKMTAVIDRGDTRLAIFVGSRNRHIVPGDDNFGFAAWVQENAEDLVRLGPGRHYGEWFGEGIQKNPLGVVGRRFALFNPRWLDQGPECVEVVPQLGTMQTEDLEGCFHALRDGSFVHGSDPDATPEGIIAFHLGSRQLYKRTFEFEEGKWQG